MENNYYGVIYRITNLINGKMYIGQTTRDYKLRFKEHIRDSRKNNPMTIGKAIKKYGSLNFIIQVLCVCKNQEQLDLKESFFIEKYKTSTKNCGYNIRLKPSGNGALSVTTKRKMSESYWKDKNRLSISKSNGLKCRGLKRNFNYSSKYVGVTKTKNGNFRSQIGFNNNFSIIGTYEIESDAAKAYDIKAIELFGKDCVLNFPKLRNDYIEGKIVIFSTRDKRGLPKYISKYIYGKGGYRVRYKKNSQVIFETLDEAKEYLESIQ